MNVTLALYDRFAEDGPLVGMLASYGDEPAIFTGDPVPGDATAPFLICSGAEADDPDDTKTHEGRDIRRRIRVISATEHSALEVETIAARVRTLLHRQPLTIDGHLNYVCDVAGPITAPTDPDLQGRALIVRLLTIEE